MAKSPFNQNTLFYGDNLDILREYIPDESIDLIYLDPPFNSQRTYNVLFKYESGEESEAQIAAFDDTWHWNAAAEETYHDLVTAAPDRVSQMIAALRQFIGPSQMLAYLVMMAARLVELHRVLKPTGSLYLHCDPTASHYLKIILDTIFGPEQFINEIVWKRTTTHSDAKRWSPVTDIILFYSKTNNFTWNPQHTDHHAEYVTTKYRYNDNDGRGPYRLDNMTSPNPRPNLMYEWKGHASPPKGWRYSKETMLKLDQEGRIWYPSSKDKRIQLKRYLNEMPGRIVDNLWLDINPINSQAAERLGYPTQKPLELLERILQASSNLGDIVIDPFCGCGTTVAAAQKLNRRWIGIDITHLSIALMKYRLKEMFPDAKFQIVGEPTSVQSARQLAQDDRFQFEWWALSLVKARPSGGEQGSKQGKKGADRGIDGVITFIDDASGKPKRILVQVKSGKVSSSQIRDLVGTVKREGAAMGFFITLEAPTRDMTTEAVSAGFYQSPGWNQRFPTIQILTIEELLRGVVPQMPPTSMTFKQAQRVKEDGPQQKSLFD
ncbi:MAG: restriction endonuclease [Anaerolineae bacterium]|nr:restriction endonuclease [Anaerolineae bacterium]